jgi:hypothetical protein
MYVQVHGWLTPDDARRRVKVYILEKGGTILEQYDDVNGFK